MHTLMVQTARKMLEAKSGSLGMDGRVFYNTQLDLSKLNGTIEIVGFYRINDGIWELSNFSRRENYTLRKGVSSDLPTKINENLWINSMEKLCVGTNEAIFGARLKIGKFPQRQNWSIISVEFLRTGIDV